MEHGAPDTLPAAVIAQGTRENQRVVTGTLATIASLAAQADMQSPALFVVGEVVSLHASLAWFNTAAPLEVPQSA